MMTLGGGRAIITLRAADRDRGSCCDCQKSWEVIARSDLLSLHSCPFTLQVAERGPWQAVVITCKTCLLQSMIWTNVSGWPMLVVRMHLRKSSGCYVCECRVPLLEGVRIGEARHMYSWGNPNEDNPDENVCHTSSGDVCHVWGGVPTITRRLLLEPRRARDACGSAAGCHKPIWRW